MKNKLRRIAAMLLSLIMTISMVGGNVLTVVALDETYAETEMETVVETKTETVAVKETGKNETTETEVETDSEKVEETQPESREEITSYGVNFNVYENSTAKVYVNGQEVTYMVTNEGKVTFIVEPENQFEVNVDKTISANPNFNIQKTARTDVNEFEVSGFSNDITVNIYTQKIPETESEEPPSEESKESESETQRIETSETKESESENTEKTYELTIQHVLETNIGLYADERTITLTDADFVDGVYDLSKQVYHREGIYTTSAGSIAREDFDSENRGYAEITYAVAEGWKAVPKRQIFTRSIFVGTFDDVEIVPAGQLPVTFNFVYEDGTIAKASETIMFQEKDGGGYDVSYEVADVPAGYTLSTDNNDFNVNGNKLTASFPENAEAVELTVTYAANTVNYKVRTRVENLDGVTFEETETTAQGNVGELTEITAEEKTGFTAKPITQQEIKADGSTVVAVEYVRNTYTVKYNTNGGSYIPAKNGKYGAEVEVYSAEAGEPVLSCGVEEHTHTAQPSRDGYYNGQISGCWTWRSSLFGGSWRLSCGKTEHTHSDTCYTSTSTYDPLPTKPGYTFEGWFADEACTTPADKSVTLEKDVTVYAKWTAKKAGYTIAYFRQVWDNSTNSAHYVYDSSVSASGVVGTTVTGTAKRDGIANCEFAGADSATIKADGSTVVNVYYNLIQYTFIFALNDRNGNTGKIVMNGTTYDDVNRYEIKAVLGQDISALWPTTEHTSRSNGDELDTWNGSYKTKRFEVTADMVTGADENHKVIYGAQWMDDGTKKTVNYWFQKADGSGYEKEERYCQEFVSDSGLSAKNIYGFTKIERPSGYPESSDTVYNFYYNRNSYAIEYYYNGTQLKTASNIRFGADISSSTYNYTPERPEGLDSEYTFAGWYDNAELLGEPYNFTTMPANTLALYAKWEAPDKTVTLVYNDGSANGSITVKKGEVAEIPVPEREGYDFAGWYSDIGCLVPFDVNAPVTQDVIIYAKWMKHLFTQYTVRYVVADETAEGGYRDIADSKTLRGMVDSVVREKALALDGEYAGYAVDASSKTLTLKSSASENVIMFIYTSPADLKYKVQYTYNGKVVREDAEFKAAPATKFRVDPSEDDAKWLNENGYERNESFIIANLVSNNDENIITFTLKLKPYTIKYEGIDGITGWTEGTGTENPNRTSYTIEDEFTLVTYA